MNLVQSHPGLKTDNRLWNSKYSSPLGWITATWNDKKLARLTIDAELTESEIDQTLQTSEANLELTQLLNDHLKHFFAGSKKLFPWSRFDLEGRTEFQLSVLKCCYKIPSGETMSYGQVASAVGRPGAARAVGTVMAQNTLPLLIPCHRVVASGGGIGGYSARGGVSVKEWLLARESGNDTW
jgi:methylated-DNA-[protein]-cysteine S-methyltransferase